MTRKRNHAEQAPTDAPEQASAAGTVVTDPVATEQIDGNAAVYQALLDAEAGTVGDSVISVATGLAGALPSMGRADRTQVLALALYDAFLLGQANSVPVQPAAVPVTKAEEVFA